jgi:hypothetical protein
MQSTQTTCNQMRMDAHPPCRLVQEGETSTSASTSTKSQAEVTTEKYGLEAGLYKVGHWQQQPAPLQAWPTMSAWCSMSCHACYGSTNPRPWPRAGSRIHDLHSSACSVCLPDCSV